MSQITVYWLWVIAMAAALFYPVSRLIWVVSIRRLQKKLQTSLSEEEVRGQKQRAHVIAIVLCTAFSMLFNFRLLG